MAGKIKQLKTVIIFLLIMSVNIFITFLYDAHAGRQGNGTRTVIDMYDRDVVIPGKVKRVACFPGPSYEMVFMLGGRNQISEVRKDHRFAYPLANLTNPDLVNYSSRIANINPKARINIEQFIKVDPDVIIYYNVPQAIEQFEEAGIPVFVYQSIVKSKSMDGFIGDEKRQIRSIARLLDGTAPEQAEKWCRYYDEKISLIRSRTKDIPDYKRPKVYWGNSWGVNPLATWGGNSHFDIHLCGGRSVTESISNTHFPEVTLEQLIAWNPDILIIDNHGREAEKVIKMIYNDRNWSVITAVKNKRIHRIPSGVFFLSKGSSKPVYLLWLAGQLAPERFTDIDMVKEMKIFFKEFYHYDLSTKEAEHALKGWDKWDELSS